jgi:DNA-binding transcriptional MocR family regulator
MGHSNTDPTLYGNLADSVRQLIDQSTLRPGHRIPSVRRMALQRGVSISTVVQAYTLLESGGYLEARPQSGYYVRANLSAPEPRMARPMGKPSFVGPPDVAGDLIAHSLDPRCVQLGAACPDPSLFPVRKLARLLGSVVRDDPALIGTYCLSFAYEPLAREIARRYLQGGTPLSHGEFVVTVGCTEALNLSLRAVTQPGDTVAIETPAYYGFLQTIHSLNLRALEIPTDPRTGLCLDAARAAFRRNDVKALIVMPCFQNPLGSCMPDSKKEALYGLLREHDMPAIEDDIYGDLHADGHRPKPLKAWDTDGRVLLCGSFGKSLAPGLRIGWCAPGRQVERVRRLKFANTLGTPVVLQKAVSDFLRNGGYDHHLRSIRRAYRRQLDLFSQGVLRHFPEGTRISRPQGGFVLWIEMPAGVDSDRLHGEALALRINFAPGSLFSVRERYRNCLRLNCGVPWSGAVDGAIRTLGRLARRQLGAPSARGTSDFAGREGERSS